MQVRAGRRRRKKASARHETAVFSVFNPSLSVGDHGNRFNLTGSISTVVEKAAGHLITGRF